MTKPLRAALYARVSTLGKGQDVGLQLDELRQVAAQRGWSIVAELVDEGISGSRERRPALDELMGLSRAGKLDLVAVFRFDRFARSTAHLLAALEEFRLLGVSFVSLHEQVDTTTPMGKAMFTIIAAVAELERGARRPAPPALRTRIAARSPRTGARLRAHQPRSGPPAPR